MRVIDTVKKAVLDWPSLYYQGNYEDSEFEVLHHYFIVLGNGIEWAHTKNPKQGGYLTHDSYYKRNGEYVRRYDKPYGKEVTKDISHLFGQKLYDVILKEEYEKHNFTSSIDVWEEDIHKYSDDIYYKRQQRFLKERLVEAGLKAERYPYPNFSKRYSCFWKPECAYIQDDWRDAARGHLTHWLEYFNDPQRHVTYSHCHVTERNIREFKEWITKRYPEKSLTEVAVEYGIPNFQGATIEELSKVRWDKTLSKTLLFLEETLKRLA